MKKKFLSSGMPLVLMSSCLFVLSGCGSNSSEAKFVPNNIYDWPSDPDFGYIIPMPGKKLSREPLLFKLDESNIEIREFNSTIDLTDNFASVADYVALIEDAGYVIDESLSMGEWGNETRTYKFYHKEDGPPVGFYDYTFHWTVDLSQLRGDHGVHDYSTRLYIQWNYTRLIPE